MIVAIFTGFLLLFVLVGLAAAWQGKNNAQDYFLAGRNIAPSLTALSAASTGQSGFMFIAFIGFTYTLGLPTMWFLVGYVIGDFLMSIRAYPAIRTRSAQTGSVSYAGMLARWNGEEIKIIRPVAALISLAFLALYAAAQFRAGSKALTVLFEWPEFVGMALGAGIIFIYCLFGGIRASIWTDALQAIIMITAMGLIVFAGLDAIGGFAALAAALPEAHMHVFDTTMLTGPVAGPILFLLGWVAGGIGFIGQPHIMVRYMTMRNAADIGRVRLYYYSWIVIFYTLAVLAGLIARVLLPETSQFDPELAMPNLAGQLLPGVMVGFILSAIFAATISTADSQIISCATVVAHDLMPEKRRNSIVLARLGTCLITVAAFLIALYGPASVFTLVLIAWAGLSVCFGPIMLVYLTGGRMTGAMALAMMAVGMVTILVWRQLGLQDAIYEALPGVMASLAVYVVWAGLRRQEI